MNAWLKWRGFKSLFSGPWTDEQIREINADMAAGIIREIGEVLQAAGCCHGHDMASVPPMFYAETIVCAIRHASGKHTADCKGPA